MHFAVLNPRLAVFALWISVLFSPLSLAHAGTISTVQSAARPFGLDIVGPVQAAGSDERAAAFLEGEFSGLQDVTRSVLTERQMVEDVSTIALRADQLRLDSVSDLRVYFMGEGAGYRNTLGFYTGPSSDRLRGDASLIFPDASMSGSGSFERVSRSTPLRPGDFVDLGSFDAGTNLNLFLVANGANRGTQTFYSDAVHNSDGIDHFVALAVPNSEFLLVGVEDLLGGGDEDYNDVVFALDVGISNVQSMIAAAVPLPPAAWAGLGVLGFLLWSRRREAAVAAAA